tara:strand:+ start:2255 stop:3148 length:894 start_codon:yes stop_codon:yes gene_type:complete
MFTSQTASREKALLAAAAAERAMKRHECCKSQFKFRCFSCGEMINRGDKITKCTAPCWDGMRLRFRGADSRNGLNGDEVAFYLAETGTRTWVHIGCNPCYWDSLPEDSNEYSPPALRSVYTDWEAKISHEFDEWRQLTNHYDMEEFLGKHGYPQEKWMKDRIIYSVTRFQAIWRGYIYKQAYPIALRAKKATETFTQNARKRSAFLYQNSIGAHMEILMDKNHPSAALYSGKVIKIQGLPEIDGLYYWIKYHHDSEMRRYHWKKLLDLKFECETFKSKHGILAKITGKLPLYKFLYP